MRQGVPLQGRGGFGGRTAASKGGYSVLDLLEYNHIR